MAISASGLAVNTRKMSSPRRSTAVGRIAQVAAQALEARRLFSTIVVTSAADAANYSTSVTVSQLNPGTTPVTLRDAIDAANNTGGSNTIDFSSSLTTSTISISTIGDNTFGPSAFAISSNLTINGGSTGMTLAGDAANESNRLFYVKSQGNLTLQNLTVSGFLAHGGSSGYGGAGAGLGGAIVNAGTLNLLQDAFVNNQAIGGLSGVGSGSGGGGLGGAGGSTTGGGPNGGGEFGTGGFGGGGGLLASGGFGGGNGQGGTSSGFGGGGGWFIAGGFGAEGGDGAGMGGAIFNYGGSIAIADSTLADNSAIVGGTATGLGGAIFNLNGSIAANNDTFAYNAGGALYSLGDDGIATQSGPALPSTTATVTLNNSILADSSGGSDFVQNTNDSSGTGNHTGSVSSSGSDNIIQSDASGTNAFAGSAANVNPLLAGNAPANYGGPTDSFALLPGSPAIDAGSNTLAAFAGSTLTTDQRGDARIVNNAVDIGAYESPGFSITTTGSGQSALTGSTFSTALGVTVTANDTDLTDLAGGLITLSAPSSGASASFATNPLTLSSSGTASTTATANSTAGAYTVSASAAGIATAATYSLANEGPPAITTNPASQTFQTGDFGTLTSTAAGFPVPTVQWYALATGNHWDSITFATYTSYTEQFYRINNGLELRAVFTNTYGTVTSATATITVIGLTPTAYISATGGVYDGSPFTATASVAGTSGPAGSSLESFTPFVEYYTGSTTTGTGTTVAPTAAGTYTAVTQFPGSLNYTSATSTAATFTITQALPALDISASGGVYNGSSFSATATVTGVDGNPVASLEGVSPTITYYAGPDASGDASTVAPNTAGTYTAVADFPGSVNYVQVPAASDTFIISQATPSLSVADAGGTYDGSAFAASISLIGVDGTATTSLDGVTPTLTYYAGIHDRPQNLIAAQGYGDAFLSYSTNTTGTGSTVAPTSAGTYTAVADFPGSVNYVQVPAASATFTIAPATAYFAFSNLSPTYDGRANPISVSTDPVGLAMSVTYTQNGHAVAAPVDPGTYTATATVTDPNYTGTSQITFAVEPATISLSFAGLSATFNGAAHPASNPPAIADSSDTTLASLLHLSYQNTVSGTVTDSAPVYPGTYRIFASFAGNADYSAIPTFNTGQTVSISPFIQLAGPTILQRTAHTALTGQLAGSIPVKGGKVTVQIGGTSLTAKLKKSGVFTVNFPTATLAAGQYTVLYTYSGPSNFNATTWTSTLTVRPRPAKSKSAR